MKYEALQLKNETITQNYEKVYDNLARETAQRHVLEEKMLALQSKIDRQIDEIYYNEERIEAVQVKYDRILEEY